MVRKLLLFLLAFFAVPAISQSQDIVEIAAGNDDFSTLVTAVQIAGLQNALSCDTYWCRSLTVFAPTNEAFAKLPTELVTRLTTDPEYIRHLRNLLYYHLVYDRLFSNQIQNGVPINTVLHESVTPTVDTNGIRINNATVTIADIPASNGVVHAIDSVLVPSFLTKSIVDVATDAGQFGTLLAALGAAGLDSALAAEGTFTVFAPTDAAFAKLGEFTINALLDDIPKLTSILQYHVLLGTVVTSDELRDDATVQTLQGEDIEVDLVRRHWWSHYYYAVLNDSVGFVTYDVFASNGVIHVIDTVLVPPSVSLPQPTITQLASTTPGLETLVQALSTAIDANLVGVLNSPGPFTVFAPTNAAFEALGDTLEMVLQDQALLTDILLYHVADGEAKRNQLQDRFVETKNGAFVEVDVRSGRHGTFLNGDTRINLFDVDASNGVVHVIDKVLLPPANIVGVAQAAGFSTLVDAAIAAGLADALQGDGPLTVFAPTNAAFAALGEETLNSLLNDPATLSKILLYHVIPGRVESDDLVTGPVQTLAQEFINVSFRRAHHWWGRRSRFFINESRITDFNVNARNGIIHVIDQVLIPPSLT